MATVCARHTPRECNFSRSLSPLGADPFSLSRSISLAVKRPRLPRHTRDRFERLQTKPGSGAPSRPPAVSPSPPPFGARVSKMCRRDIWGKTLSGEIVLDRESQRIDRENGICDGLPEIGMERTFQALAAGPGLEAKPSGRAERAIRAGGVISLPNAATHPLPAKAEAQTQ